MDTANSPGLIRVPFCCDHCRDDFHHAHSAAIATFALAAGLVRTYDAIVAFGFKLRDTPDTCAWCTSTLPEAGARRYTLGLLRAGEDDLVLAGYLGFGAYIEQWVGTPQDRWSFALISVPQENIRWMTTRLASGLRGGARQYATATEALAMAQQEHALLTQ